MWSGKGKTAIVGVGYSQLTRHSQKPLGLVTLDACRAHDMILDATDWVNKGGKMARFRFLI